MRRRELLSQSGGEYHRQRGAHGVRIGAAPHHRVAEDRARGLDQRAVRDRRASGSGRDQTHHPAVAVDADEPQIRVRRGRNHLAAPRPHLHADFRVVLAQRFGQVGGHLTPLPRRLRRRVGRDRDPTVRQGQVHRLRCTCRRHLDLQLRALRHRQHHRAEIETLLEHVGEPIGDVVVVVGAALGMRIDLEVGFLEVGLSSRSSATSAFSSTASCSACLRFLRPNTTARPLSRPGLRGRRWSRNRRHRGSYPRAPAPPRSRPAPPSAPATARSGRRGAPRSVCADRG